MAVKGNTIGVVYGDIIADDSADVDHCPEANCSFGSMPSETLVKISLASEPRTCFCEKGGEGEFVCGWEPKNKKTLLRTGEKESKKLSPSSNMCTSYSASSYWSNLRNNIPNLRPWTNKNKPEQEQGGRDYVFKHLASADEYIADYRINHIVRTPSSASCSSLGMVDCPDPYMNKLKNYRDLFEKLKTLSQQDQSRKSTRILTPSVIRDKSTPDFSLSRPDVRGLGSSIDGTQSLSLGLYSQKLSPRSQAHSQKQAIADAVQMVKLARCRSERAKSSTSTTSDSSEDNKGHSVEQKPNTREHQNCASVSGWITVTEQTTAIEASKSQSIQSKTSSLQEKSIPIAEIHFGAAPAKGKTWSSGSGQYMNLSFPKATFPAPVRVALAQSGSYSMDSKRNAKSPRSRRVDNINLTPTGRQGVHRGSRDKNVSQKLLNGMNVVESRRRLPSDPSTINGSFSDRIHNNTSSSLGALTPKIYI